MKSWQFDMSRLTKRPTKLLAALALLCAQVIVSANAWSAWHSDEQAMMGTSVRVELWHNDAERAEALVGQVMAIMREVDVRMSPYREQSELSQINRDAAQSPVKISPQLFALLAQSEWHSKQSEGAFDITFASVGHRFHYRHGIGPDEATRKAMQALIDYRAVRLDREASTVRFLRPGVRIDLGGIAKGYAVDAAIALLRDEQVQHAMVKAGGDSRMLGDRRGRPWWLGIKHPRESGYLLRFPVVNQAVSTSGDYERYFIDDEGERHHHIIHPASGRSAQGVQSVTVIADNATLSDALSTTLFVMGIEKGLRYIKAFDQVSAIMIDARGQVFYSDDLVAAD